MFEKAFLDKKKQSRAKPMIAAIFLESAIIALLVFAPLFFNKDKLNESILIEQIFFPPSPPPGPPAGKPKSEKSENKPASQAKPKPKPEPPADTPPDTLQQPTEIPKDVVQEDGEEKSKGEEGGGNPEGVPGGEPCNAPDCVIGGTGESKNKEKENEPPPDPPRVGGKIKQAKIIHQVDPVYPPLAKKNGVQGDVVLETIIGTDGATHNIKVKSGHALLRQSAVDAVEQWKYEPATLNGEPTEVTSTITVKFVLK